MKRITAILLTLVLASALLLPGALQIMADDPIRVLCVKPSNANPSVYGGLNGRGFTLTEYTSDTVLPSVSAVDVIVWDTNAAGVNANQTTFLNSILGLARDNQIPFIIGMNAVMADRLMGLANGTNTNAGANPDTTTANPSHEIMTDPNSILLGTSYFGGAGNVGCLNLSNTTAIDGMTALIINGSNAQTLVAYSASGAQFKRISADSSNGSQNSYTMTAPVVTIGVKLGNAAGAASNANILNIFENAIEWAY